MVALISWSEELADRLLRSRTVVIGRAIDDLLAAEVIPQLFLLDQEKPGRPITMLINSPGGSVSAGLAIYDVMQGIQSPVATVATGLAASMAQVLLCAGEPDQRFATMHAEIMMHQGSAGIGGIAADIAIQAERLTRTSAAMHQIISQHTGQSVERVAADGDRDHWLTAAEAKEYGMIDHVLTDFIALTPGGVR